MNRPGGAHDRDPERGLLEPRIPHAREVAHRAVGQPEHRRHRVACDQADALRPRDRVGLRDRPPARRHRGLAPLRRAAEVGHQVEHVTAENPEILAAAALVFLASRPQFEHPADPAVFDHVTDGGVGAGVAIHEGEREFRAGLFAGGHHRVGISRRRHEGLLHQDATGPRLGRGDRHLGVAVDVPHADRHHVGLRRRQHLPPVGEGGGRIELVPLGRLGQAGRVVIGGRDHDGAGLFPKQLVDRVAVVAAARPPDHRHPQPFAVHVVPLRGIVEGKRAVYAAARPLSCGTWLAQHRTPHAL